MWADDGAGSQSSRGWSKLGWLSISRLGSNVWIGTIVRWTNSNANAGFLKKEFSLAV